MASIFLCTSKCFNDVEYQPLCTEFYNSSPPSRLTLDTWWAFQVTLTFDTGRVFTPTLTLHILRASRSPLHTTFGKYIVSCVLVGESLHHVVCMEGWQDTLCCMYGWMWGYVGWCLWIGGIVHCKVYAWVGGGYILLCVLVGDRICCVDGLKHIGVLWVI